MNIPSLDDYKLLTEDFLVAKISCEDFAERFMVLFQNDESTFNGDETIKDKMIFSALNELFTSADMFEPDPNIREAESMYIDEKEFLWSVRNCLKKIKSA